MEYINNHNPILPPEIHIPDSEAHVMSDGKLYIYGSFDNRIGEYCSDRYYVVSTPDLKHWTIKPDVFKVEDIPWILEKPILYPGDIDWLHPTNFISKMIDKIVNEYKQKGIDPETDVKKKSEPLLFAPDCIEKKGKYYLYFCLNDGREGVAVGNNPEGPFHNSVQLPCGGIDPAVFIDDDGKAYYYLGQIHSHGIQLNEDMISFCDSVTDNLLTEEEHFFHEGSSVRKIGDMYYCVFADVERGRPTALGYATSKSPLGPFQYRGIIVDNAKCDPSSWNNHGSIECFNGQWYVFYHRSSRGTEQNRKLCIEPITIEADGTIKEVKMTSQGIGEPFAPNEVIMGYQACELNGEIYIGPDKDGKEKLLNIADGDEAIFRYVNVTEEYTEILIDSQGTGSVEVFLNEIKVGTIQLENSRQINKKIKFSQPGIYELKLRFIQPKDLRMWNLVLLG